MDLQRDTSDALRLAEVYGRSVDGLHDPRDFSNERLAAIETCAQALGPGVEREFRTLTARDGADRIAPAPRAINSRAGD